MPIKQLKPTLPRSDSEKSFFHTNFVAKKFMKNIILLALTIAFLSLTSACSDQQMKQSINYLPSATGSIDEVIVVMNENFWLGNLGDDLRASLMTDYEILPQREPLFDLRQVPGQSFTNLLQRSSVVLVVGTADDTGPTTNLIKEALANFSGTAEEMPSVFAKQNVWSSPQQVVYIYGKNEADLSKKIKEYEGIIIEKLYEMGDKKALKNSYVPGINDGLTSVVYDKFGLNFKIPNKYEVALSTDSVMWLRFDNHSTEAVLNVIISRWPYEGKAPLISQTFPIELRNEIGKYVSGQAANSYMIADTILPFLQTYHNLGNVKAVKSRGLWRLVGDFMGGPFVNYCFNDEKRQQTINIDGFVYAPKSKKRPLMRKLTQMIQEAKVAP